MLGLAPARESLDDDHAATAAGTWTRQHALLVGCSRLRWLGLFRGGWSGEQLARSRDVGGTIAAGKQPVAPNAMKALWQHMDQEATDKLVGRQRHRLVAAWSIDPIVLVPEGDAVVVGSYEAAIGDGHAVGKTCLGPANGSLASTTHLILRSGFR